MKYLSDEWLTAASEAVADISPTDSDVTIGYVVGDDNGETAYSICLGPESVSFMAGVETAGVVLRLARPLAEAIARGETSAQRAFLDGQIRLGGDALVLLGNNDVLSAVDERLAEVRKATVY